jgi:UDP-N-acetylmuramate--alanine ligase
MPSEAFLTYHHHLNSPQYLFYEASGSAQSEIHSLFAYHPPFSPPVVWFEMPSEAFLTYHHHFDFRIPPCEGFFIRILRIMTQKHIHCIGIGGIGISALARYYLAQGYRVTGTNLGHSPLLDTLASEGIEIVSDGADVISENTEKVIYTEAIIDDDTLGLAGVRVNHKPEIEAGQKFQAQILSYPEALADVLHAFPMKIAVAGAHGKSTTSAMIGTFLHDLQAQGTTITGTLVKAFNGRNISAEGQKIMNIEACEYRNAFLKYTPDIAVVTNIDPDHLDFFKTEAAYTEAFHTFARTAKCLVMLTDEAEKKGMIGLAPTTVLVSADVFEVRGSAFNGIEPGKYSYTLPALLVPGDHIRLDAQLAYVVSQLL